MGSFWDYLGQGIKDGVMGTADKPGIFGQGQFQPDPNAAKLGNGTFWQDAAQKGFANAQGGTGVQLNRADMDESRGAQMGLMQQLQGQANGTGPSLAQGQLQRGLDTNMAQTFAMAAANPNDPGAARNAANQRASMSQQSASDAAQMRMQEQLQAQNQLGQLATGMRGQDIGVASDNANLQQQAMQYYMGAGMTQDQAQAALNMQMQQLKLQGYLGAQNANEQFFQGMMGSASGGLGAMGMAGGKSDARVKKNIKPRGFDVLPGVPVVEFEYIDRPGRFVGVLAQDLEKVAPEHVMEDADGVKWVSAQFAPVEI